MSKRTDNRMTQWLHDAQRVLAPLSAFGFDTMFEDATAMLHNATGYPPYNVIRNEGETIIEVALAGLSSADLKIYVEANILHITYENRVEDVRERFDLIEETKKLPSGGEFVHKGIASRSFDLTLPVAQGVVVSSARMKDGLLRVRLVKVPPPEPQRNFVDIATE